MNVNDNCIQLVLMIWRGLLINRTPFASVKPLQLLVQMFAANPTDPADEVFLCFGILAAYFALCGLWSGVSMGILATCVSFAFFQMSQFEGLPGPEGKAI